MAWAKSLACADGRATGQIVSAILPVILPDSSSSWALAASARPRIACRCTRRFPRLGQVGEGPEGRVVGFNAQARETAPRRLGAGGEIGIAPVHDRDQQAAGAQYADRAPGRVTADGVEHNIHAADMRGEVGGTVVDELIGAQARDEVMLGRARRAGYVSAASLGDLDRQVPDTAAGPMDQHPLTLCHLGGIHERLPCGKTRQRKRGGFGVGQAGGLAGKLTRRRRDILRVRTGRPREEWHAVHLVARLEPGHAGLDVFNHPADVPAEYERRLAQERELPGPDHRLDGVYSHCPHPDQHLGGQWHRSLHLSEPQHFWTAEGLLADRLHRCGHRDLSFPTAGGSLGTTLGGR